MRADAADQKQKDDALAAQQLADNDSLRDQTQKLLADKSPSLPDLPGEARQSTTWLIC